MRFAAACPICKRDVIALSMAMLEIKAKEHHAKCSERERNAITAKWEKRVAEAVQPSLPFSLVPPGGAS